MIVSDGFDFQIFYPDSLNEASITQLELYKSHQVEEKDLEKFASAWFLSGLNEQQLKELEDTAYLESVSDIALMVSERFLSSKEPLTRCPYPEISYRNIKYQCVSDHLSDMHFGQFVDAEEQLSLYLINNHKDHLRKLCSVLYKPAGSEYYSSKIKGLSKGFGRVMGHVRMLLLLEFYLGCRQTLASNFRHIFPKQAKKEDGEAKPVKLKPQDVLQMVRSYHAKLVQFAKSPEKKMAVYQENVYTVLEFIDADMAEYKRWKKEQEDLKRKSK